jgi:hypothetical protein
LTSELTPKVFRTPAWARYLSLFGTLAIGGVAALMLGFAVVILFAGAWGLAAFTAATAWFLAALTGYVLRDLRGKWGLRVELGAQAMRLDLPGGRSLIHRPPAEHRTIPYADIAGVETRLEAYESIGLANMQRAYVLRTKTGELIFLFEDRALGTKLAVPMFDQLAADIAARAHVAIRDLGMVKGKGGVLVVWGTDSPPWSAPSLPLAQQLRLWRHAAVTGMLAIAIMIIAVAVRLIVGP